MSSIECDHLTMKYIYKTVKSTLYRITTVWKVEKDNRINTTESPIGQDAVVVILYVETFKTDVIGFFYQLKIINNASDVILVDI
jgi:hypothetical protein